MAAPPGIIDVNQLYANFKEVYGDKFLVMSRVDRQLYDKFPFEVGDEPGRAYYEAIRMTEEQGYTFNLDSTSPRPLNPSIALKTERAGIVGNILEFRSSVDAAAIKRGGGGLQSFKDTIGIKQEGMRDSVLFHTEWTLLRGGTPCGVIDAIAADPGGVATRRLVTLTAAGYADAFWSNSENMPMDIYDTTSATLAPGAVRRNTVVANVLNMFRIIAWLPNSRQLIIEADLNADWGTVVQGDCLWRTGSYLKEDLGMMTICGLSGQTVFGISQTQYGKWNPFIDNSAAPLSMQRIQRAIAGIRGRSAMKSSYTARMHPVQWEAVHNDITALRRFDASYKMSKAEQGHSEIEFYSAAGTVKLISNVFMPLDKCIITDESTWTRRGVSDIDFNMDVTSASGERQMYVWDPNANVVQFRVFSQQAMFCNQLNRNASLGNLTIPV